jgi:hypothetical protein
VDDSFVVVDSVTRGLFVLAGGLPCRRDDQFGSLMLLLDESAGE